MQQPVPNIKSYQLELHTEPHMGHTSYTLNSSVHSSLPYSYSLCKSLADLVKLQYF